MTVLNLAVTVSGNDGGYVGTTFSVTNTRIEPGKNSLDELQEYFYRFTGVSGLSSSTINSANLRVYQRSSELGTALTKIHVEMAAAPAAPTAITT